MRPGRGALSSGLPLPYAFAMRRTFFTASSLAFLASILAKTAADAFLTERVPVIGSFAGFQRSFNPGIAFGIRMPPAIQTASIIAAVILLLFVVFRTAKTSMSQIGFGLILGGALGNILDRVRDGLVTDFFQVGTFPIFNVADSCITIGVVVLLFEMFLSSRNHAASRLRGKGGPALPKPRAKEGLPCRSFSEGGPRNT